MPKNLKKFIPLLAITIIFSGILLRLWRLKELFHFTYDEEIFAFIGKRMFINHHIPLIGGVTPMHVHVAPYFYWLSGFFLYLSHLNPLGWGVVAALIASFTMIVLYILGKELFGKGVALLAIFFYSISFFQNIFDRHYWGITFDGLVSVLSIYALAKIIKGHQKYFYLLVAVLAFGINSDLSTLTLVIVTIFAFLYFKPKISSKTKYLGILLFILAFSPLIFFDLRHNFVNSKGILQYLDEIKQPKKDTYQQNPTDVLLFIPRSLARTVYVFGDTDLSKQYSYCPQYSNGRVQVIPTIMTLAVLAVLLYGLRQWKKNPYLKLILSLFLSTYLGIIIYGVIFKGPLFDHYLATLFPIFFLLLGFTIQTIFKKIPQVIILILALFLIMNIQELATTKHAFGFADKEKAVKWAIANSTVQDFSLDVLSSCFRYNGYRYLFYQFGKEPTKSYVDQNLFWLYDNPPAKKHPPITVVVTNPDWRETDDYSQKYEHYKTGTIKSAQFGKIEVLIVDNSNGEYNGDY